MNPIDSILLKQMKDLLGDLVGSVSGGRARGDTNPDHNGTKTFLPILSVGDKPGRVNGVSI